MSEDTTLQAVLTGIRGTLSQYNVAPVYRDGVVIWIDPAGYELARTDMSDWEERLDMHKSDFKLIVENGSGIVSKVFLKYRP